MKVLGIHVGHDSSAALVVDGRIAADAAEERFRRVKHCAGLPTRAIEYCLSAAARDGGGIDAIALATTRPVPQLGQWLAAGGGSAAGVPAPLSERIAAASGIEPPVYLRPRLLPAAIPVHAVAHHLAHAASAYYTSGCAAKQLIVTLDGIGDGRSTCLWRAEHGRIEPLLQLGASASLGWFYGCVTEALGWWHGDGEGKTMALAAYGDPERCRGDLAAFHPRFAAGALASGHDFGTPAHWPEAGTLHWHLREADAIRALVERHGREHVAAAAQRILEDEVLELVLPWLERERVDALACAGGVFLNVKLNQRLWESGRLAHQHVFPNAGDAGIAAGAALHVFHQAVPDHPLAELENVYFGPEYGADEIEACLQTRRLAYHRLDDPAAEAARRLAGGEIVGWFQGRMESGPRALGNRSILMSAAQRSNADVLNARVKFREAFRPFCPSLPDEQRDRYLLGGRPAAFMTTACAAAPAAAVRVPAAVHVDGSMRPQTLRRAANPRFWDLLNGFGARSGEHLLLNTSLNLAGEPLVNTPSDAIRCFFDSGLDALVLDRFLLTK